MSTKLYIPSINQHILVEGCVSRGFAVRCVCVWMCEFLHLSGGSTGYRSALYSGCNIRVWGYACVTTHQYDGSDPQIQTRLDVTHPSRRPKLYR